MDSMGSLGSCTLDTLTPNGTYTLLISKFCNPSIPPLEILGKASMIRTTINSSIKKKNPENYVLVFFKKKNQYPWHIIFKSTVWYVIH